MRKRKQKDTAAETTVIMIPPNPLLPGGLTRVYVSDLGQALNSARSEIVTAIGGMRPGETSVGLQTADFTKSALDSQETY